jgi:hypothetical protein
MNCMYGCNNLTSVPSYLQAARLARTHVGTAMHALHMIRVVPIRILTFSTYRIYGVYTVNTRNFRIYAVADKGKSPERADHFNLKLKYGWCISCALRNGPELLQPSTKLQLAPRTAMLCHGVYPVPSATSRLSTLCSSLNCAFSASLPAMNTSLPAQRSATFPHTHTVTYASKSSVAE